MWDWITGYDSENAEKARIADEKLRAMNQQKRDSGYYDDGQWEKIMRDYSTDTTMTDAQARASIGDSFDEGWEDGRKNVSGFIGGAFDKLVASPLKAILGGIPWYVWLGGGLFLAWKLGLLDGIFRKAKP